MEIIFGILRESVNLLNEMSAYLLFGFIFAGIIHIFLKEGTVAEHLGKSNWASVVKASLFGIPLPLCSCGVIPAALSLKKEGASKGSILSFLISTPTTGIDSIMATYALIGGFFAFYRVLAAFIAGIFAGVIANLFLTKNDAPQEKEEKNQKNCCHHHSHEKEHTSFTTRVKGVFQYAFEDLLGDIGGWLILGILIGGLISFLIPESFISTYLGSGWKAMFIMLLISVPMYVCASGSLPIAAALMLKGLNPGAAFVFLFAGPATNSAAVTVITKELGYKTTIIFLTSIVVSSLILGFGLDSIWQYLNIDIKEHLMHGKFIPVWLQIISSIVLIGAIIVNYLKPRRNMNHESKEE